MARQNVMVIDLQRCTGCNTCSVACKQENNLPEGVWWTQVITVSLNGEDTPSGNFPDLHLDYLPLACQHCVDAPCLEVCPSEATHRSDELGVVELDPTLCIGCRYCMLVCPYTGVRVYASELHYELPFATGGNPMIHRERTVEKCTFCAHRLEQGLLPACVDSCPMEARKFGDLGDPHGEVAELLRSRAHFQLLVEKGTRPSVYYLT
jgi:molybdopterin-containing oxidoreductase family iron-sulfur binding subunit